MLRSSIFALAALMAATTQAITINFPDLEDDLTRVDDDLYLDANCDELGWRIVENERWRTNDHIGKYGYKRTVAIIDQ